MATRFYLFNNITPAITPALNAGWGITAANTYRMMIPNKTYGISAANVNTTSDQIGAAAVKKGLIQTYISQPLIAQTILSGSTISIQARGSMNSTASRTGQLWAYARVCNEDGSNLSEIGSAGSTNLTTSATNRTITITLGSNVTIADNQRIIIEFGWNYLTGSVTTTTCTISFQVGITASDLPADNTTTTALNPFVEFSQTLNFRNG